MVILRFFENIRQPCAIEVVADMAVFNRAEGTVTYHISGPDVVTTIKFKDYRAVSGTSYPVYDISLNEELKRLA